MNKKTGKVLRDGCRGAAIAATYVIMTFISASLGLSSGIIQFRISEALCILGVLIPAAVPGVTLGCLLANLLTGGVIWDILFGTLASLAGMLGVRALRSKPYLAPLPYVAANVIAVPLVLKYAYGLEGALWYFALTTGIGELACAWAGGVMLLHALKRTGVFRSSRSKYTDGNDRS